MTKEIQTITISYEQFTEYDHIPLGNYFFKNALGEIIYLKTGDRQAAQDWIDNYSGVKGKYKAIPSKTFKTKSKLESGGLSCTGSSTRRGQRK